MRRHPAVLISLLLLLGTSCGGDESDPTGPSSGSITLSLSMSGEDIQPDACSVSVDGGASQPLPVNDPLTVSGLVAGMHTALVSCTAPNCSVVGDNPISVTVVAGQTTQAAFQVECEALVGSIEVLLAMSGQDVNPNACSVSVDDGAPQALVADNPLTVSGLDPGLHTILLSCAAPNCSITGQNPLSVSVEAGDTTPAAFQVECEALAGAIEVSLAMSGFDLDQDGCIIAVDGMPGQRLNSGETFTFPDLPVGEHEVTIDDVAGNCQVDGTTARAVTVGLGQTEQEVFSIDCEWRSRIAFASLRGGDYDVYVVEPDGTGLVNLTNHFHVDESPTWSPDGVQIAFSSRRDGNADIFVMNADGTGPLNLTNVAGDDSSPTWSPDGTRIAFISDRDGTREIYVMNVDGTGQERITEDPGVEWSPAWSPDGTLIAFDGYRDDVYGIYVINADGTGQPTLIVPSGWAVAWSPDGSRIAFTSGDEEIYVANADGTGQVNLTSDPAADWYPTWSPDGSQLAFLRFIGDNADVFVMNADGTGQERLTDDPGYDTEPSWSPDLY